MPQQYIAGFSMVPQWSCNVTMNPILIILTRFHDNFATISMISLWIPQILDDFTKLLTILQQIHDDFDDLYKFDEFPTKISEQNKFVRNDFTTTTIAGLQLHNDNVVMTRGRQWWDNNETTLLWRQQWWWWDNTVATTLCWRCSDNNDKTNDAVTTWCSYHINVCADNVRQNDFWKNFEKIFYCNRYVRTYVLTMRDKMIFGKFLKKSSYIISTYVRTYVRT